MIETNEARLVCRVLYEAGGPLTRREIARAIEPQVIPNLRLVIEDLMKRGKVEGYITASETETTIMRYILTENVRR